MADSSRKFGKGKYADMKYWVQLSARMHSGKAVFAVLVFMLIQMVFNSICLLPVMAGIADNIGVQAVACCVLILGANVVLSMLLYGLNVIMAKLVTGEYVTLGFLFIAFKKNTKKIVQLSIIHTVLNLIVILILAVCSIFAYYKFYPDLTLEQFILKAYGIISIVSIVILLPFLFAWLFMYDQPDINPFKAFGLSAKLYYTQCFHFIGFEIVSGGWALLSWVVLELLNALVGQNNASLARVLSFCGFMFQINAIIKMFLGLPVYFYFSIGKPITGSGVKTDSNSEEDDEDEAGVKSHSVDLLVGNENAEDAVVVPDGDKGDETASDETSSDKTDERKLDV